jgi:hypothetical protein
VPYCSVNERTGQVILDRGRGDVERARRRIRYGKVARTARQDVVKDEALATAGKAFYARLYNMKAAGAGTSRWYPVLAHEPFRVRHQIGMPVQLSPSQASKLGWLDVVGAIVGAGADIYKTREGNKALEEQAKSALKAAKLGLEAERVKLEQAKMLATMRQKELELQAQIAQQQKAAARTSAPVMRAQPTTGLPVGTEATDRKMGLPDIGLPGGTLPWLLAGGGILLLLATRA